MRVTYDRGLGWGPTSANACGRASKVSVSTANRHHQSQAGGGGVSMHIALPVFTLKILNEHDA